MLYGCQSCFTAAASFADSGLFRLCLRMNWVFMGTIVPLDRRAQWSAEQSRRQQALQIVVSFGCVCAYTGFSWVPWCLSIVMLSGVQSSPGCSCSDVICRWPPLLAVCELPLSFHGYHGASRSSCSVVCRALQAAVAVMLSADGHPFWLCVNTR